MPKSRNRRQQKAKNKDRLESKEKTIIANRRYIIQSYGMLSYLSALKNQN